jgi:hypothetical protein
MNSGQHINGDNNCSIDVLAAEGKFALWRVYQISGRLLCVCRVSLATMMQLILAGCPIR